MKRNKNLSIFLLRRLFCLPLLLLTSCIFNVSLTEPPRPLVEEVVSGSGEGKILMLDISGIITMEEKTRFAGMEKKPSLVGRLKEELEMALRDENIKALILKINSPGGMVTASDIIHHELLSFKKAKGVKIVACLMEMGTSGAYYIACAADHIMAHPTSVTGSIGVLVMKFNFAGLMEKVGVIDETIKSGAKKDILLPFRQVSEEEKQIVQGIVDDMQERFLQVVRRGRPALKEEHLQVVNDGRILSPGEAQKYGLIDEIGYLDEAIEKAKKLAGLEEAQVITYTPPSRIKANLYSQAAALAAPGRSEPGVTALKNLLPDYHPYFMYLWMP